VPISSVNFGRWLERLGFKHLEQPAFHQSVTPVSIVQDQQHLVSAALGPSGLVGGIQGSVAGEFSAFQFVGPSPAWIDYPICSATTLQDVEVLIGATTATLPVLNGAVTCIRQVFQPGGDVRVQRGSVLAVGSATDTPAARASGSLYSVLPKIFKPAGGWVQINSRSLATTFDLMAALYELPPENAQ
jgi:hypothetical protein